MNSTSLKLSRLIALTAVAVLPCVRLSAQTSPAPKLVTTALLSVMPDGDYRATVTIANSGNTDATDVYLTAATLAQVNGSPVPEPLANIPAGGQVATTVLFGSDAGSPGSLVIERYSGTYAGGSFGGSLRATLPTPASVPTVTSSVDFTQPGPPTPSHFLGFSMDSNVTDTYVGSGATADPILVNLIENFTPYNDVPSLRPAAAPATSTSSNISAKFLHALTTLESATQAPLLVTIGLGTYNPTYAGNVAASVTAALGNAANLQFELGNEPDQLARQGYRPSTYSFSDYTSRSSTATPMRWPRISQASMQPAWQAARLHGMWQTIRRS